MAHPSAVCDISWTSNHLCTGAFVLLFALKHKEPTVEEETISKHSEDISLIILMNPWFADRSVKCPLTRVFIFMITTTWGIKLKIYMPY